jgi:hypothetical protein
VCGNKDFARVSIADGQYDIFLRLAFLVGERDKRDPFGITSKKFFRAENSDISQILQLIVSIYQPFWIS